MQTATLTINEPRLQPVTITVTAASTAEIALYTPPGELASTWYTLLIDGRHHFMIQWKHLTGNIAATEVLDRALAQVRQAIAALQPPPTPHFDAMVAAALERLAEENARSARTARAAGLKDDARFFQRACNAYVRALSEWQQGTRPTRTPSGGWLLPSRSGGADHLLTLDGDWLCSCSSGTQIHWASALIIGLEVAQDDLARFDDGDDDREMTAPNPEPPTSTQAAQDGAHEEDEADARRALITRLCAARARLLAA
jgi:hypothetical protein